MKITGKVEKIEMCESTNTKQIYLSPQNSWFTSSANASGFVKDYYVGKEVEIDTGDEEYIFSFIKPIIKMVDKPKEEHKPSKQYEPAPETESFSVKDVQLLRKSGLETEKKNNLTYASWSDVWDVVIQIYPQAQIKVHENDTGMPYFADDTGGFVKVSVTIKDVTHTSYLPIMNHSNKSIPKDQIDTFAINKAIQRALVKAIAMFGLGLYIYRGEDIVEE